MSLGACPGAVDVKYKCKYIVTVTRKGHRNRLYVSGTYVVYRRVAEILRCYRQTYLDYCKTSKKMKKKSLTVMRLKLPPG